MLLEINIDSDSGFCFGVVNAIEIAENELSKTGTLYCIGDIVHNPLEVNRLKNEGLTTINASEISQIQPKKLLIRAHGEPPSTYKLAAANGVVVIDATCPIVRTLQQKIALAWKEMHSIGGQVVIFGKRGHPEVIGLNGHAENNAIIIGKANNIETVDFDRPIRLFSQTTMDRDAYQSMITLFQQRVEHGNFEATNSVCRQVSGRKEALALFVRMHDLVLFVAGRDSSNGEALFQHCYHNNHSTKFIEGPNEIEKEWLLNVKKVGICGATSTPRWLMNQVAVAVKQITE